MTLEEFKKDNDWLCAFEEAMGSGFNGYNTDKKDFLINGVVEIIAKSEGENDGPDWIGIFKMNDGKYINLWAGCDYTGWDCQANGSYTTHDTLNEVLSKKTLCEEHRDRLKDQLSKYELDWLS